MILSRIEEKLLHRSGVRLSKGDEDLRQIEAMIAWANSIPVEYQFRTRAQFLTELKGRKPFRGRFYELIMDEVLASFPAKRFPVFRAYMAEEMDDAHFFFHAYTSLGRLRDFLRAIAHANAREPSVSGPGLELRDVYWQPDESSLKIVNGILTLPRDWATLLGLNVSRVAKCAVCGKLFWQYRRGVVYCRSGLCGNKFNVDKFRGKEYTQKYKENRALKV